ncbi:hypothetical protein EYF80_048294 [Liparis tanakae]|uniref:Uncharacterized protein n=1 Tax=Liparis tanakae TaxID=230148 RepID=A0A4Z2FL78_9TELE|nr:hypothetical protein EYF80_048294 [Liparis tanakae]
MAAGRTVTHEYRDRQRGGQGGSNGFMMGGIPQIPLWSRWLTMQNGSGRFLPQVEVDDSWWARPIRRSPVAG